MLRRIQLPLVLFVAIAAFCASAGFAVTGYIDTPDECYVLEKMKGNNVYLKSAGKREGRAGRAYVEASGTVRVYTDGAFWRNAELTPLSIPDIEAPLKKAKELERTLKIPENKHEKAMLKEAKKLDAVYRSPEFQQKLADETERIKTEMFGEQVKEEYYADAKKPEKTATAKLQKDERVYLFISSSMPMTTIRNYVASVARLHDGHIMMVMRGFVQGMTKIGPTMLFTSQALKVNPSCEGRECETYPVRVIVDPLLFRRYGISRVPAVVFARGVNPATPESSEGDTGSGVSAHTTIYGDASLEYMLDQIRMDTGSASLKGLLEKR